MRLWVAFHRGRSSRDRAGHLAAPVFQKEEMSMTSGRFWFWLVMLAAVHGSSCTSSRQQEVKEAVVGRFLVIEAQGFG